MIRGIGWIGISALAMGAASLAAQGPGGPGFGRGFGFGGGPGHVVTGEPFTDASTSTSVEKLADGTTITHSSTGMEARDSQGRTLTSVTETTGSAPTAHTTLFDPVAHTMTSWSSASTTATQIQLPANPPGGGGQWSGGPRGPRGSGPGGPGGGPGRVRPTVTRVVLSPTTIAGVSATGVKTTMTIPAGAEGNDNALVSTREIWTSPDLKIVLREIGDSPRDGFHKMEVTSLTTGDPDPSLFQVPSNYTVKVETRHRGR